MIAKISSDELRKLICDGFVIIKKSNYSENPKKDLIQKKDLLGSLLSLGAGAGWRPKALTIGALQLFVDNKFRLPQGLERAHIPHRRDTLKELINTDWIGDEWWDWFKERDYTVLATRAENRDEKNFESLKKFSIPLELNLFWGKRVGFEYGKEERAFLEELAKKQTS